MQLCNVKRLTNDNSGNDARADAWNKQNVQVCNVVSNQIKSSMTLIMVDKPQPSYNLLDVMK